MHMKSPIYRRGAKCSIGDKLNICSRKWKKNQNERRGRPHIFPADRAKYGTGFTSCYAYDIYLQVYWIYAITVVIFLEPHSTKRTNWQHSSWIFSILIWSSFVIIIQFSKADYAHRALVPPRSASVYLWTDNPIDNRSLAANMRIKLIPPFNWKLSHHNAIPLSILEEMP